jgi:hypothetical protein
LGSIFHYIPPRQAIHNLAVLKMGRLSGNEHEPTEIYRFYRGSRTIDGE